MYKKYGKESNWYNTFICYLFYNVIIFLSIIYANTRVDLKLFFVVLLICVNIYLIKGLTNAK